jgi:hypothetical protein
MASFGLVYVALAGLMALEPVDRARLASMIREARGRSTPNHEFKAD